MGHAIISLSIESELVCFINYGLSQVMQALCVSGCNSSESNNEQHEGVVNASVTVLSE